MQQKKPYRLSFQGSFVECVEAFVKETVRVRRADPLTPIVALVGSHVLREQIEKRLTAELGGVLGVRLLTFRDLASRLGGAALRRAGRMPATRLYQEALLLRLLRESTGCFRSVGRFPGAAGAMLATFEDLEENGWDRWPDAAPRDGKLGEVGRLFAAYRAELTASFFTSQDELRTAAEGAGAFAAAYGASILQVVGIYDVNPLQERLLRRLAAAGEVRLYLPRLVVDTPFVAAVGVAPGEWHTPAPDSVSVCSCPSEVAEAEQIVRRALRFRRLGVAFHEMVVLLRHQEIYIELLAEAAGRAGVPLSFAAGLPPHRSLAVRMLLRLLELAGSPLRRSAVLAFLAAVDLPPDVVPPARWTKTQSQWDRISRQARVKQGGDWKLRLSAWAARPGRTEAEREAVDHLSEAVETLRLAYAEIAESRTYARAAARLAALARQFIRPESSLAEVLECLAELAALDRAGLAFELEEFRRRARQLILDFREEAGREDGLRVLDWWTARGSRFRVVFVPGCVESLIPQPARQDPILLDRERAELSRLIGEARLPLTGERAAEELRLFDLTCRAAAERLVLTFPRLDADDRPRLPSHLLLALADRLTGRKLSVGQFVREKSLVETVPAVAGAPGDFAEALDDNERDFHALAPLLNEQPAAAVRYLSLVRPTAFGRVWRRQLHRWAERRVTVHEGLIESAEAMAQLRQWLKDKAHWSVSELEDYGLCPRLYFFKRVLGLDRPDDPEIVLSLPPDVRGALIHSILEKTAAAAARLTPAARQQLVADAYRALAEENLTGGGLLDEVELERVDLSVKEMLAFAERQSGGYRLQASEAPVATRLALAGGRTLCLHGRLDRVDRDGEGRRRIVDYKTGKAKNKLTDKKLLDDSLNAGMTLQIPFYLVAVENGTEPGRHGAYWFLKDHAGELRPTAVCFSADFFREKHEALQRLMAAMVADLGAGRFVPRPDVAGAPGNGYCANCSFTVVCDGRSRAVLATKKDAAALYSWLPDLEGIDEPPED